MLPDLSSLSLATDAELFKYVTTRGGGKAPCTEFTEDRDTEEDKDWRINCAIDGFLMYKPVPNAEQPPEDFSGKSIDVVVDGLDVQLNAILTRDSTPEEKYKEFANRHTYWVRHNFHRVCDRGEDLSPVYWGDYKHFLMEATEWYFLDEKDNQGHLFVQLCDTTEYKMAQNLPTEGVFANRYLYIALVCANAGKGYGSYLLNMAEAVSRKLGCSGIVLASLSNSAGFYYSKNFKFISRLDGVPVDVSAWTEIIKKADGSTKTWLRPEWEDVEPFDPPRERNEKKRVREEEPEEAEEQEEPSSLFRRAVRKAIKLFKSAGSLSSGS